MRFLLQPWGALVFSVLCVLAVIVALVVWGERPDEAEAPQPVVTAPNGEAVPVPASLPAACQNAYAQVGGPLMSARDGFKNMLLGGTPDDIAAGAQRVVDAHAALNTTPVKSALLDCSSASRTAGPALQSGVDAVEVQHLAAGITARRGDMPYAGRDSTARALEAVEHALAVR